eukprot:scaffold27410_cov78-Cyclotella_meneghiniana.AAC.3
MATSRTVKWTTLIILLCLTFFLGSFNATMRIIVNQRKDRLLLNQMPSIVLSLSYYIIHPSTFTSSSLSSTFSYVYFDTNTENIEGPARHHPRNQTKNPPPQQHPQKHLSRKDPIPSPSRTRKKHKRHFKKSPSNKLNMQN